MPDWTLAPSPAVAPAPAFPGIAVEERSGVALCHVLARKGALEQLLQRVQDSFALRLPDSPKFVRSGAVSFVWSGPAQWLAVAEGQNGREFQRQLTSALGETASVVDQSDGRAVLRLSGPRCYDVLSRALPIDLHPSAFRPGSTAITTVAHIGVHLWQVDSQTYDFAMFRSFAVAFAEWLADVAA